MPKFVSKSAVPPSTNGVNVLAVPDPFKGGSDRKRPSGRLFELLEFYLRHHYVHGSTAATINFHRKELELFLRFLEAQGHSMDPGDVGTVDVLGHLEDMKLRGLAARTLRTRQQAILTFFNWAIEWEILSVNPAKRIRPTKVPKRRKPFLKPAAFMALLDLCPLSTLVGARRQAMLWLMVQTGIRKRELWLLTKADLDWTRGEIRIVYGKGQKERASPFPQDVQFPMLRYLAHRTDELPCLWITEESRPIIADGLQYLCHAGP